MIETTTLENFQRHIREYKQSCALKNNYEEAQATLHLSQFVFKEIQKRNFLNYYSSSVEKRYQTSNMNDGRGSTTYCNKRPNLVNQNQYQNHAQIENQVCLEDSIKNNQNIDFSMDCNMKSNFSDESNETIEQFNMKTEEKRLKLIELHKQQLEQFENIWHTEMPKKYIKPSARLLGIKKKSIFLLLREIMKRQQICINLLMNLFNKRLKMLKIDLLMIIKLQERNY